MATPQFSSPPSRTERMVDALRDLHRRYEFQLTQEGKGAESLPAWYLHLPSGIPVRIKTVGRQGPFLRFVSPDGIVALVAPEVVSITAVPPTEEDKEERFPIGFQPPTKPVE